MLRFKNNDYLYSFLKCRVLNTVQRSQDQTFSTTKERLKNPNVDSYPDTS